jgi:chemotaxis protein MotB
MAKKHKHEEHQNHERWVISYADMVTLLFALFVVLYALGEVKMKKLKELKKSLAFAFHFEGSGQTQEIGVHNKGDVGGDLLEAAMIVNPQRGDVKEYLLRTLPQEFEEISGKSLDIILSDDTVSFTGPLSAFFAPNSKRLRPEVHPWLTKLVEGAHAVASRVRIRIDTPQLRIGEARSTGAPYFTMDLCQERLSHLQQLVSLMATVAADQITHEFHYTAEYATIGNWEEMATITVAFSNPDK